EMRDAPPALCDQMLDRQLGAALVVGQQRQRLRIVGVRENIDHREAAHMLTHARPLVRPAGGDHQPIDPLAEQLVEVSPLALRIVGGVAHEDGDAVVRQPILECLDDREREPPEAVVGEDADRHRLRPVQALRQIVRPIAELPATRSTFSRVFRLSRPLALSALLAVPIDTSASRATSRIVGVSRSRTPWDAGTLSLGAAIGRSYFTAPLSRPET